MDIFEAYEMSEDALRDGVWAELVLLGKEIGRIKVRPSDPTLNPEYRKALATSGLALKTIEHEKGEYTEADTDRLTIAVIAETILTDWQLYTDDGKGGEKQIRFSQKKAIELLTKLPKLLKATQDAARQWTMFRRATQDEAVKS